MRSLVLLLLSSSAFLFHEFFLTPSSSSQAPSHPTDPLSSDIPPKYPIRYLPFALIGFLINCSCPVHGILIFFSYDGPRLKATPEGISDISAGNPPHPPFGIKEHDMNISIIGTGYVGLVPGACFAEFGVTVTCMDTNPNRVQQLPPGELPFSKKWALTTFLLVERRLVRWHPKNLQNTLKENW